VNDDAVRACAATESQLAREINVIGLSTQVELLVEQLVAARDRVANLEVALQTNRRIAMAIGIVMARRGFTEQQAFAQLRAESQRQHRKLRELAEDIVLTGEVPGG
jgi:AmiR/NasT family two-component response regulator